MKTITLGEICEGEKGLVQTGPFGSQLKRSEYSEAGVPVIMPSDIVDGKVDVSGIARVPRVKADSLARHYVKQGTIVMPRRGDISKRAFIDESQAGFLCGTGCIKIEIQNNLVNPKFLFYYLDQDQVVDWIERQATGTTMLNLNTSMIERIEVPLLPREKQDKIADILSAFDDLIEVNRQRIERLERAARLLYREWFVHHRFPGHEHTEIVDGVPEGWERANLSELVSTQYGYTESASEDPVGPHFLRGTDINKTSYVDWDSVPYCEISESDYQKYQLKKHDIVVVRMADPGKCAIVEDEVDAVFASYLIRITPESEEITPYYLYFVLDDQHYQQHMSTTATGSTRKSASAGLLVDYDILIPPGSIIEDFESEVIPMRRQIATLLRQNAKLRRARNILLPRLMSGEITV